MTASIPVRLTLALRLCAGAALGLGTAEALLAPDMQVPVKLAGCAVIALTAWKPAAGLVAVVALAPAGLILAAPPARAAEMLVWAFLATWLLCAWRPLTTETRREGALLPALLYGACALASWAGYTIRGAPGVAPHRLPATLVRAVGTDHLVFSSPEPETWTLLASIAGLALFASAATIARGRPEVRRQVAAAIALTAAVMGVLTTIDVLRQWAEVGYGGWFLLRYVQGERFSFHLRDLNAAGTQYVLGGLISIAMAAGDRKRRALWIGAVVLMLPALYLSGSRSAALGAFIAGGVLIPVLWRASPVRAAPARVLAIALIVAMPGIGSVFAASGAGEQGTASSSLRLRSQFLVTSARMFASAPIFGVGIGHYHERSNEFMPPALREVYRHENAHNYFAQQFAELGLVGGALFVWLVIAALRRGWRAARGADPALVGLLAGSVGYLLTCVTGHPLLVPEAALPFWGAFGVLAAAAAGSQPPPASTRQRIVVSSVVLILALGLLLEARRYALAVTQPGERGFYGLEKTADGTPFVWMTRHGVFYVGPQPGTLVVPVQAPAFLQRDDRFVLQVEVGGKRAGVYEVAAGQWTTIEIPLRERAPAAFRRIDLRANRSWTPRKDRGGTDDEPRSVMVGETRWSPAGAR